MKLTNASSVPWKLEFSVDAGTDVIFAASATNDTGSVLSDVANAGASNGTTKVDVIAAPAADHTRIIDFVNFYNSGGSIRTLTVNLDINGTDRVLRIIALNPGEALQYSKDAGWQVFDTFGRVKILQTTTSALVGEWQTVVLGSDVTNNNAVANTIQDVTGLSFPVTANQMYWFEFNIFYTAAAATTGSRWSINGPASPTKLIYTSEYSLAATTTTRNANNISYDLPAASNATSGATGSNQATIYGCVQPISNGNLIARFASEVSSSAIVAKAGSFVRYLRTV